MKRVRLVAILTVCAVLSPSVGFAGFQQAFASHAALFQVVGAHYEARTPHGSLNSHFSQARQFVYVPDKPRDRWQLPEETEKRYAGDCEDKALWLYKRLKQSGYGNIDFVVGKFRGVGSRPLHAWVVYRDPRGEQFILDPTTQRRIWQDSQVTGYYKPLVAFNDAYPVGKKIVR